MAGNSPQNDQAHDNSLIDWFLSLTAEQRLEELEARVQFLIDYRINDGTRLSPATHDALPQQR